MQSKVTLEESRKVVERFVESFNELRYRKLVKTKKEFCEAVEPLRAILIEWLLKDPQMNLQ